MAGKGEKAKRGPDSIRVELPEDCRMAALPELRTQLLAAVDHPTCLLDGSAVARIDTAALQMLAAFRRDAISGGREINWGGTSDVMCEAAALLGLTQTLELPAAMSA
ncbi:MAG: STAS domain-containing protein [Rhodanobacter sp.]